jgi:hypothetical protein
LTAIQLKTLRDFRVRVQLLQELDVHSFHWWAYFRRFLNAAAMIKSVSVGFEVFPLKAELWEELA